MHPGSVESAFGGLRVSNADPAKNSEFLFDLLDVGVMMSCCFRLTVAQL